MNQSMDRISIIQYLENLYRLSSTYEAAQCSVTSAQIALKTAQSYSPSRLATFDSTYKENFIRNEIGEKPKAPSKWNPLNHTKKRKDAIQKSIADYEQKRTSAEAAYYKKYQEKRQSFKEQDRADKVSKIAIAQENLSSATSVLVSSQQDWESDTLLSSRLRNAHTIKKMLEFFEDGRVDNLKEAVNLYYDEVRKEEEARLAAEHRQKIENMIADQNSSIQHAVDLAETASEQVSDALQLAREALDRADAAYERAESASSSSSY